MAARTLASESEISDEIASGILRDSVIAHYAAKNQIRESLMSSIQRKIERGEDPDVIEKWITMLERLQKDDVAKEVVKNQIRKKK